MAASDYLLRAIEPDFTTDETEVLGDRWSLVTQPEVVGQQPKTSPRKPVSPSSRLAPQKSLGASFSVPPLSWGHTEQLQKAETAVPLVSLPQARGSLEPRFLS